VGKKKAIELLQEGEAADSPCNKKKRGRKSKGGKKKKGRTLPETPKPLQGWGKKGTPQTKEKPGAKNQTHRKKFLTPQIDEPQRTTKKKKKKKKLHPVESETGTKNLATQVFPFKTKGTGARTFQPGGKRSPPKLDENNNRGREEKSDLVGARGEGGAG